MGQKNRWFHARLHRVAVTLDGWLSADANRILIRVAVYELGTALLNQRWNQQSASWIFQYVEHGNIISHVEVSARSRKAFARRRERLLHVVVMACLRFLITGGLKHGNGGVGSASSSRSTSPSQQQPSQGGLSFIPQPRNQNSANRQPTATTPR